jgi:hypothetical protein
MPLRSNLLAGNKRLQRCLVSDPAHVMLGDQGEHVRLIQVALILIDDAAIDQNEIDGQVYGRSTAGAVLAYKKARRIINTAYQSSADNIVGKMTIKSLDDEMLALQEDPLPYRYRVCRRRRAPIVPIVDLNIRIGARMRPANPLGRRV